MHMVIHKAYRFRLRPSKAQESHFRQFAGCRRFAWNKALGIQENLLRAGERLLSYKRMAANLPAWKLEHPFLAEPPSQALQQVLMDLDRAIRDAFNKKDSKRFPVFKKKGKSADSFRLPQGFRVEQGNGRIFLPKVGWVRYRNSRKIEGKQKQVTVSRSHDGSVGYKLEWAGGELILVNPAYTSQECSACHHVARENRKTRDKFECVACGHAEDADVNAAKNIKAAGLAVSACGGFSASRPPMKQELPCGKERCHAA